MIIITDGKKNTTNINNDNKSTPSSLIFRPDITETLYGALKINYTHLPTYLPTIIVIIIIAIITTMMPIIKNVTRSDKRVTKSPLGKSRNSRRKHHLYRGHFINLLLLIISHCRPTIISYA